MSVMHGPDGIDYKNKIVYIEIVEPERLVYFHTGGAQFQSTATFAQQGGKTSLTVRNFEKGLAQMKSVVEAARTRSSGRSEG